MLHHADRFISTDRFLELAALPDALDPDFDAARDDLEREFQELRLQLTRFA